MPQNTIDQNDTSSAIEWCNSYDWGRNVLYSMEREGKKMKFMVDM